MKMRVLVLVLAVASMTTGGRGIEANPIGFAPQAHHVAHDHGGSALASAFALPTAVNTRALLEGAVHTSEFIDVGSGRDRMQAFVSYPDRGGKAPVVIVTTKDGMSDFSRAVAYQAARDGFIAIAPDRLSPAVQQYAAGIPAASGTMARLDLRNAQIDAHVTGYPVATFARDDEGWTTALAFLSEKTGNHFTPTPGMDHVAMEMRAEQAGRGGAPTGGLNFKADHLPANWVMAGKIANTTPRRNEWIDVPVPGATAKVHTWVVYPDGDQKVGTVLVLHGASGMSDWIRSVADQLAKEGFIALAVDLSSGLGPNGGNFDSFRFTDDLMRATQALGRDGTMARIKAVRDYAAKMPRSNGKTGSIGFCGGGTNSFQLATDVAEHNASVVYYGAAPPEAQLAKTTAPVIGFYGENDARIFSTVEGTRADMKRLGKSYEAHTYPRTTHSFLWMQDLGDNLQATEDSWPRAIAFYRQHLKTPAPATR